MVYWRSSNGEIGWREGIVADLVGALPGWIPCDVYAEDELFAVSGELTGIGHERLKERGSAGFGLGGLTTARHEQREHATGGLKHKVAARCVPVERAMLAGGLGDGVRGGKLPSADDILLIEMWQWSTPSCRLPPLSDASGSSFRDSRAGARSSSANSVRDRIPC